MGQIWQDHNQLWATLPTVTVWAGHTYREREACERGSETENYSQKQIHHPFSRSPIIENQLVSLIENASTHHVLNKPPLLRIASHTAPTPCVSVSHTGTQWPKPLTLQCVQPDGTRIGQGAWTRLAPFLIGEGGYGGDWRPQLGVRPSHFLVKISWEAPTRPRKAPRRSERPNPTPNDPQAPS
jgi:hypothetical protein